MNKIITPILLGNMIFYFPNYITYYSHSNNDIYLIIIFLYFLSGLIGSIMGYYINSHSKNNFDFIRYSKNINILEPYLFRLFICLSLILFLLLRYKFDNLYYPPYYNMGGYGLFFLLYNSIFLFILLPNFDNYSLKKILIILTLYIFIYLFILNRLTNSIITVLFIALYLLIRFKNNYKYLVKISIILLPLFFLLTLIFLDFFLSKLNSLYNQINFLQIIGLIEIYDYKYIFYKFFMPLSFYRESLDQKSFYSTAISNIVNHYSNNPGFSIDPILELYLSCSSNLVLFSFTNCLIFLIFNYLTCNLLSRKSLYLSIFMIYFGLVFLDLYYLLIIKLLMFLNLCSIKLKIQKKLILFIK